MKSFNQVYRIYQPNNNLFKKPLKHIIIFQKTYFLFIYKNLYKNVKFDVFNRYFERKNFVVKNSDRKRFQNSVASIYTGRKNRRRPREKCNRNGEKEIEEIKRNFVQCDQSIVKTRPFPQRKKDRLENAMDRGALDKRGDTGLIATFTLTAHQSRSTTLYTPIHNFLPPIRKRENR